MSRVNHMTLSSVLIRPSSHPTKQSIIGHNKKLNGKKQNYVKRHLICVGHAQEIIYLVFFILFFWSTFDLT